MQHQLNITRSKRDTIVSLVYWQNKLHRSLVQIEESGTSLAYNQVQPVVNTVDPLVFSTPHSDTQKPSLTAEKPFPYSGLLERHAEWWSDLISTSLLPLHTLHACSLLVS